MFFLKQATESSFLISIGILFHSLVAETAKQSKSALIKKKFNLKSNI